MSKFPDVIVIVRDKKNFALIGSFQVIGSAKPCKEFLKVGAPVRELVFCLLQNGFTITEQGEVGVFFRTR